jgi:hypothetical protein
LKLCLDNCINSSKEHIQNILKNIFKNNPTNNKQIMNNIMNLMLTVTFLFTMNITSAEEPDGDKVKMRDVETLLFRKEMMTTGRRSKPVSQMICEGHPCKKNAPDSISCKNIGWDGKDPIWDCTTSEMKDTKLSKIEVQCEGYEYPDDPNILVGSCAVIFQLNYKDEVINSLDWSRTRPDRKDEPSPLVGLMIMTGMVWGMYSCCSALDVEDRTPFVAGAAAGVLGASLCNSRSSSWGGDSSWGGGGGSSWSSSSSFGGTSRR